MTTTITRGRTPSNGAKAEPIGIEPAKRRHRSLPLALVAVICMVVSILAFVGLQLASSDSSPVLAVARPVEAGAVIVDADLRVAEVPADPALSPIALSARSEVVGRTAAVDLQPGTLLVDSALGEASVVDAGEALVGIEVSAASAPVDALRPGDRVQVVAVPRSGETTTDDSGTVIAEGRVLRVSSESSSGAPAVQLSVVVPVDAAPSVTAASASGRVAVVVLG